MSIGLKRDLDKQRVLQNTGEPEPKKLKPEPISTDLHYACETNNLDTVIEYSDEGEDLEGRNWRNDTPLISAAKNNALDTVEWLLENNVSLERGGWCYETPLIAASTENNMEIVKLLLDEDAG
jgi:ankyrin repeat protein